VLSPEPLVSSRSRIGKNAGILLPTHVLANVVITRLTIHHSPYSPLTGENGIGVASYEQGSERVRKNL